MTQGIPWSLTKSYWFYKFIILSPFYFPQPSFGVGVFSVCKCQVYVAFRRLVSGVQQYFNSCNFFSFSVEGPVRICLLTRRWWWKITALVGCGRSGRQQWWTQKQTRNRDDDKSGHNINSSKGHFNQQKLLHRSSLSLPFCSRRPKWDVGLEMFTQSRSGMVK